MCGTANAPAQKFCGECGSALAHVGSATTLLTPEAYTPKHLAERILTSKSALEGERKHVTVLFADLKGPEFRVGQPRLLVLLGEIHLLAGHREDAARFAARGVARAREHRQRGDEAMALHLAGEIAARREPVDVTEAEARYREGLALATQLGMRPLVAHCHLGLGTLYGRSGKRESAREHLTVATRMYREMEMPFWLSKVEAQTRVSG
jgi:hypothetical protein